MPEFGSKTDDSASAAVEFLEQWASSLAVGSTSMPMALVPGVAELVEYAHGTLSGNEEEREG